MADARRFVRDNLVFVAAFALPGLVAGLFLLAMAIPRWTVPSPQHDLVLRIEHYDSRQPQVHVNFVVREGRLEADVRAVPRPTDPAMGVPYTQRWALLLFDHAAMQVREIPFDVPQTLPDGETRTIVIDAFGGRQLVAGSIAPDGYRISSLNTGGGGGIVGEVFGMSRNYSRDVAIEKDGRTIKLGLPVSYRSSYGEISPIGWIEDARRP